MANTLEAEAISVVLLGSFNPAIFQPDWFFAQDLLAEEEREQVKISVIHPDVASFSVDWFQLVVEPERFSLVPTGSIGIRAYDLALRIFGDLLAHTPLRALGVNYLSHFRVRSERVQNELGDRLAPKEPWGEWGARLNEPTPKDHPHRLSSESRIGGLRSIVMTRSDQDDNRKGFIQVKVEPSALYRPGVYVEVNNHFDLMKPQKGKTNTDVLKGFEGLFDGLITRSRSFTDHFMTISSEIENEGR